MLFLQHKLGKSLQDWIAIVHLVSVTEKLSDTIFSNHLQRKMLRGFFFCFRVFFFLDKPFFFWCLRLSSTNHKLIPEKCGNGVLKWFFVAYDI